MRYDPSYEPPAPVIGVKVVRPFSDVRQSGRGKLDSGADITVIPADWVKSLGLLPAGSVRTRDFAGKEELRTTYFIDIWVGRYRFEFTKAVSSPRRDALIGRDVLNGLRVLLDGKKLEFEVSDP